MSLPKEAARAAPHITTIGGTLDDAMAAELLRPLFNGADASGLLEQARHAFALVLKERGLVMGPAVLEPAILYSLSLMDRQIRFEVIRPGRPEGDDVDGPSHDGAQATPGAGAEHLPDEVLMQGCIRLLGRLACHRAPHECTVSVQVMLGKADASTYFAYHDEPIWWQIRESPATALLRRNEHADVLPGRWPEALATMSRFLANPDSEVLIKDAVYPDGRTFWQHLADRPAVMRGRR